MRVVVADLRRFYRSPLGDVAARMGARRLAALWGEAACLDVLGLGYATPYLGFARRARRVAALMPGSQGAERWPPEGPNSCAQGDETRLPFVDSCFDRIVLAHILEEADAPRQLLREVWRVTAPEGRIVVVVANRVGLWARAESTPFGTGRPYSRPQLAQLLEEAMFAPTASARALYAPPIDWSPLVSVADGFERAGETIWPAFGGILLMEAVKRLAATPSATAPVVEAARARVAAPRPAA